VKGVGFSRFPLLWKIVLSTSVAVTALFALVGWIVQSNVVSTTTRSLEDEVRASFQAYQSQCLQDARPGHHSGHSPGAMV
jgi:hypothetical protein